MLIRYKVQQDKGVYCLKGCDDGDLVDYSAFAVLKADFDRLTAELAEAMAEVMEQARCNGMGAERELKLIAERDALRAALVKYGKHERVCSVGKARRESPKFSDDARAEQFLRMASFDCVLREALRGAESEPLSVQPSVEPSDSPDVIGGTPAPMPTEGDRAAAYERLYKNRIELTMVRWGFSPHEAALNAQAEWDGAEITDFSDDPEAAADESMSYWDDDE